MNPRRNWIVPAGCLTLVFAWSDLSLAQDALSKGRQVYETHCAMCHGTEGDGKGEAAASFKKFPPRSFKKGVYRWRSTSSGQLPTDQDLRRSIVQGLRGSGMVPQGHLSDDEVRAVIDYIKAFSPRFAREEKPKPMTLPAAPPRDQRALERGAVAFRKGKCTQCHGPEGKGDGPSAKSLTVPPSNLRARPYKYGSTPEDIVQSLMTGLDGSAMPSYHLFLEDEELWWIAYYLDSLATEPTMTEEERLGWQVENRQPEGF